MPSVSCAPPTPKRMTYTCGHRSRAHLALASRLRARTRHLPWWCIWLRSVRQPAAHRAHVQQDVGAQRAHVQAWAVGHLPPGGPAQAAAGAAAMQLVRPEVVVQRAVEAAQPVKRAEAGRRVDARRVVGAALAAGPAAAAATATAAGHPHVVLVRRGVAGRGHVAVVLDKVPRVVGVPVRPVPLAARLVPGPLRERTDAPWQRVASGPSRVTHAALPNKESVH